MKNYRRHYLIYNITLVVALIFISPTQASTSGTLIDQAGMQRMLSQKIAKAYFFLGKRSRTDKARQQMTDGLKTFMNNHTNLKNNIKDPSTQDLLSYVDVAFEEYTQLCNQKYSTDNGALVLDLSEALLEVSNQVVENLEKSSKVKIARIINISGRQRMLSQRIAKYYIAYQLGFRDANSVTQLNQAVSDFEAALNTLKAEKSNTEAINTELQRVTRLWKIVKGFFLGIEKGGLPVTVFTTTDSILKQSDSITKKYVRIFQSKSSVNTNSTLGR